MAFTWFKRKKKDTPDEIIPEAATPTEPDPPRDIPQSQPLVNKAMPDKSLPDNAVALPESPPPQELDPVTQIDDTEPAPGAEVTPPMPEPSGGFLARLKKGLSKTREILNTNIEDLFVSSRGLDGTAMEELEEMLITADIGVQTAMTIMERISKKAGGIHSSKELKEALKKEFLGMLPQASRAPETESSGPHIVMVVGVNGVGKTTTIGKLAAKLSSENKKGLVVAADTFRAAAVEQLTIWAQRADVGIIKHKENADPSAVAYDGVSAAIARNVDTVYIDTAGRLHTKTNLMEELKKIKRSIAKRLPGAPHEILLVLDATTGQNALSQARLFHEALDLTGIILTKIDGTAKGGIVLSICHTLDIPLQYVGVGESIEDLQTFDPIEFVNALL